MSQNSVLRRLAVFAVVSLTITAFAGLRMWSVSARGASGPEIPSTATTLAAGDIAIVTYNSDNPDATHPDGFAFVLLRDIGSGTVINFTDKGWLSAGGFLNSAGDSTVTFTASSNLSAGTVIDSHNSSGVLNPQFSGALNLNHGASISGNDTASSDQIIAFQGTEASPTLLYAIDFGDGNTTFAANATNQNNSALPAGLTLGSTAVAISGDNATYGGGATAKPANNAANLRTDISDSNSWVFNDNSPQTLLSGPFLTAPDRELWAAASGAGEAIARIDGDATVGSGTTGYNLVQALQNDPNLFHPSDIALDTVHDKFFMIDADLGGHNRLVQGSISQILNNPGAAFTPIVLYSNTDSGATNSMRTLSVDVENKIIYFDIATTFNKVVYDTPGQTPTQLANLGTNNYITQATIDFTHGEVYLGSSRITVFFGSDAITKNYVYKATGLTSASSSLSFSQLPFNPNDAGLGPEGSPLSGEAWPVERGTIRGIDVDPVNHDLYLATGSANLDNDSNGVTTYRGGVWKYDLDGNPTGMVTNLYQQDGSTGAVGLLYYLEVDSNTNRYYVIDETGDSGPDGGSVWTGSTTAVSTTPTLFSRVDNINGLAPQGIELDTAPILTVTSANPTYTEQAGSPSAAGPGVSLISSAVASDFDTTTFTDQLAGATVRISNFVSGDQLTFTNSGGVTGSYNASTGVLTFTGISTFANYQTVLASVKFTNGGDNPTVYGANTSRTLAWSVSDGLLISDEQTTTITVVAVNDAPVNSVPAAPTILEDTLTTIPGLSMSDVDADPANQTVTVALSVSNGTLTLNTGVASGIVAGDITAGANGTASVTVTATLNKINTTLANATGLRYKGVQDYFGPDTLHIVTNDNGHTGTPGALSDTDDMSLTINPVNDVPSFTKGVDQTVLEDAGAQTVNGWATNLSKGPANESSQTLNFIVSNNNNPLFSSQPAISAGGNLTYTPAANANGTATVSVQIHDDGGTANGGVDTSAIQTFVINVTAVNDVPSFTKGGDQTVNEDSGAQTVNGWATAISKGPADENGQTLNFIVTNDNNPLFSVQPSVSSAGVLTYTPAANANGSTIVTISLHDNGGTANGGVDTSATQTFNINVTSVNDVPSFTKGADQTNVIAGSGAKSVAGWATAISAGPANESGQAIDFIVNNNNNILFSAQPAVDNTGQLTYTPAPGVNGSATVQVQIHDNGGTANGGVDTSAIQTFTISITNTVVWSGAVSSDWNTPGNWTQNFVPLSTNDVSLPTAGVANQPNLSTQDATVKNLTVASGRSLTISGGHTLLVTGTLAMNGSDIDDTGGLLEIGAGGTITRTSGSVLGSLKKDFQNGAIAEGLAEDTDPKTANALAATFTFPVGTVAGFFPVDVTPTGGSTGSLTVLAVDNPTGTLAPLTASKTLGRYWTLTGGAGITADVKFSYAPINAAPPPGTKVNGTESNYKPQRVTGGVATSFADICGGGPCVDETNHFIFMPGVTNFAGNWTASELAPTAAQVGVSGRVLSADGHAIRGVRVTLDDGTGRQMSVISNAFGYYYFSEVQAGGTYLLGATARNYTFTPRVLSVNDALTDVDLTALP